MVAFEDTPCVAAKNLKFLGFRYKILVIKLLKLHLSNWLANLLFGRSSNWSANLLFGRPTYFLETDIIQHGGIRLKHEYIFRQSTRRRKYEKAHLYFAVNFVMF